MNKIDKKDKETLLAILQKIVDGFDEAWKTLESDGAFCDAVEEMRAYIEGRQASAHRVSNIVWDIDLPSEAEIPPEVDIDDDDAVAEYLSGAYGFCVETFCRETDVPEPTEAEPADIASDAPFSTMDPFLKASIRKMLTENPDARPVMPELGRNLSIDRKAQLMAAEAHYESLWKEVREEMGIPA